MRERGTVPDFLNCSVFPGRQKCSSYNFSFFPNFFQQIFIKRIMYVITLIFISHVYLIISAVDRRNTFCALPDYNIILTSAVEYKQSLFSIAMETAIVPAAVSAVNLVKPPSLVEYRDYRFVIMDSPTDANIGSYVPVCVL